MSFNPKDAWQGVKEIQNWLDGHHTTPHHPHFFNEKSTLASNNKENIEILSKFLNKVYNSTTVVDFTILDDIKQQPPLNSINHPISFLEFTTALRKLTLGKAPGLNGVTTDALKSLDIPNQRKLYAHCENFFSSPTHDIPD